MEQSARRDSRTRLLSVGLLFLLMIIPSSNAVGASPLQLDSISMSFPTLQQGYVLSLYDCTAKTCASLRSTHDAGSSWGAVPLPEELERSLKLASWGTYGTDGATVAVHFADATNGWIYGTIPAPVTPTSTSPNWVSRLWSTHDGGVTWSQVRLDPLSLTSGVIQMATHGEWTYLFGASFDKGRAYLLATRSNSDQWKSKSNARLGIPAGGSQLEGAFTFEGSSGWFVAGNDRGLTASARLMGNGSWGAWNGPSFEHFGASMTPIAPVTSRILLAEGQSSGFVYPPASSVPPGWNNGASWLFISCDAGATFKPLRQLSSSYQATYSTVPGVPAVPEPGTILLQRISKSAFQLICSTNWGRTWRVVLDHPVSQVVFTSRTTGFAIVQVGSSETAFSLFRTIDSGNNWIRINV
jgi:photosystem II stability/assembly factor-like uncharacterized protein